MIELRRRQWIIDQTPRILFSGEVHYFRLHRRDWRARLEELRTTGAQAVATYIPWVVHELPDGSVDVTGRTADWRDLGAFCDLAHELGLYVIARPGPYVMAELQHEGLPHRVTHLARADATTWQGRQLPTADLDYLSPVFLAEVERWYDAVLPVLASRLQPDGGPVIGVQLDNEIGMLAWVSNSPVINARVAADLVAWLEVTGRAHRHPGLTPEAALAYLQQPPAAYGAVVAEDLMRFCRHDFRRYTDTLADLARARGITTVPMLINIHGTGGGRGLTYPIGISQLLGTWRNRPGTTAGSDMYLGDLTVGNVADFVLGNLFARAGSGEDQPLTALEFEAGDGDYGQDLGALVPPEATSLRTRLAHGLGNRLLNFYLYAGGVNPPLARDPLRPGGDGIDRIAFTGEEHGFAAPVGPAGRANRTHDALVDTVRALNAVAAEAATMEPHRDLTLGFVADDYLTEYRPPDDDTVASLHADLATFRGFGPRQILARSLVLGGFGLDAVDLCAHSDLDLTDPQPDHGDRPRRLTVADHPVLAVAVGHHLDAEVQQTLADYVRAGGRLLLAGALPDRDATGEPCTRLADALGLWVSGEVTDRVVEDGREQLWFPTVRATDALAPGRPDVRVSAAQTFATQGEMDAVVLVREVTGGEPCALEVAAGEGRAVVLGCDYPADLPLYAALLDRLGVRPRWRTDAADPGLVIAALADPDDGAELVHLLNVAPYPVTFTLWRDDRVVTAEPLTVAARGAELLRFPVSIGH
jgi:beta-galactosidase